MRLSDRLSSLARARPGERQNVMAAFLTLAGFMAGHALLETARDTLFLASLPASQLPWVYLAIAVVALALTRRAPAILTRLSTRHELSGWLLLATGGTFFLWLVIDPSRPWVFYILYTWSGVLATLVVVRFWTLLADLFTVTQAKRLFATVGTGSVLGAIGGSAAARVLTEVMGPRHLVAAAAGVFLVASFAPWLFMPADPRTGFTRASGGRADWAAIGRSIWKTPYVRRVAGLVLAATVTFTLVDFVFKSAAAQAIPNANLGSFFSSVYLSLNLVSLLIQVGLVTWLIRRLGVTTALAAPPALVTGAGTLLLITGGLPLALLLKATDGSLRHSMHRTGTELLFVPLSLEIRSRVKPVIDVLGQRGGQAVASLVILGALAFTSRPEVFAAAVVVSAVVWLGLTLTLKRHYLDVFREILSEGTVQVGGPLPPIDDTARANLLDALNATDDRRVIAALDVMALQREVAVIPPLVLYHPSAPVVIRALEVFRQAGRSDLHAVVERLASEHEEATVRAAALTTLVGFRVERTVLEKGLNDSSAEVRVAARIGLAGITRTPLSREVRDDLEDGAAAVVAAQTVRIRPWPGATDLLIDLSKSREVTVRREVVRAMAEVRSMHFYPHLLRLLGDSAVRDDARTALVALGPGVLSNLERDLGDPDRPHGIRRHLPRAIAAFGSTAAAEILVQDLVTETDGMIRFKILLALGLLREYQPNMPLSRRVLQRAMQQTVGTATRFMWWRKGLEGVLARETGTPVSAALAALILDKQEHAVERLFRLFALESRNDDYLRILRGLRQPEAESKASSVELLDHLLYQSLREPMLALVDDLYDARTLARLPAEPVPALPALLTELIGCGLESVSSLAVELVRERGYRDCAAALRECVPLSPAHETLLARATRALSDGVIDVG